VRAEDARDLIACKIAGPRVGYRCVYRDEYPGDTGHPRSLFVAEDRIIPIIDGWLAGLTAKNVDEMAAKMLHEAAVGNDDSPEVARARRLAEEAQTKLERYLNAIEKGMDPALYVERSRAAQAQRAAARTVIDAHGSVVTPLNEEVLRDLLARVGGAVGLLHEANAEERRQFYEEIGLNLAYRRVGKREKLTAALGVEFSRVGGPTRTRGPRPVVVESPWSQLCRAA
jgi:site-specific DNA recombinase